MRRDIGREVDIADMGALFEIDDAEKMSRIGIATVDAVAEDRGKPSSTTSVWKLTGSRNKTFVPILSTAIIPREVFASGMASSSLPYSLSQP